MPTSRQSRSAVLAILLAVALAVAVLPARSADPEIPADLPLEFREWLELVSLIISDEERSYFLSLEENFRRQAFIEAFWDARDYDPETPYNEFKRRWLDRAYQAIEDYGSLEDDRSRFLLTNGEPGRFVLGNGQVIARCFDPRAELEIWFYGGSERTNQRFVVIFFRPEFRQEWPYHAWLVDEALRADFRRSGLPSDNPSDFCEEDLRILAERMIRRDVFHYREWILDLIKVPAPDSSEWVATFEAKTTDLPPGVETFDIDVEFEFPGRNQNRTAVQGLVKVPAEALDTRQVGERPMHQLLLTGEVVRDDRLFETFRYQFEVPRPGEGVPIPLVFQRYLREGDVDILLKVEDLFGRRFAHLRRRVSVPDADTAASLRKAPDSPLFRLLEEANEASERGLTTVRLVPPIEGDIQLGRVRFNTVVSGEIDKVAFFLNGRQVMTKRRPPFSLELNLGGVAAAQRVRVVAYDPAGGELASDELLVNQGGQRFRVRLIEPRADVDYLDSFSAVVQVEVPDGRSLDRVEVFLDENRVATLYQEPFVQPILLESPGLAYIRAVGYLADGNSTEAIVFINAPEYFEHVEVKLVELFATVVGGRGRPLLGLAQEDFTVFEDGVEQEIRRFEYVENLPIHAGLLIDVSASMEDGLPEVTDAALTFVEQTIEPRDRLALISFDSRPAVEVQFSGEMGEAKAALEGLRPRGSTALYDSLIFALHYFDGVKGQKALLLLSDGLDEASRFSFENALETARRAGVTVYVIGMKQLAEDKDARKILRQLAEVTGGRAFFVTDLAALPEIYQEIQEELRSQYMLVYQSSSNRDDTEFRIVEVRVAGGAQVRTVAGYYP